MTTLLQLCREVAAKSQQLALAQRNANQQRQVQERTREWKSRDDKVKAVKARVACLPLDAEAQRSIGERRAQVRRNAAQVLERLTANDSIAQLTNDASWARLLASVEGLAEGIEIIGKAAWKSYISEQGPLEETAWLRSRAPSTPMNDAAIAAYQRHYGVYADLVKLTLPRSGDDLARLSQAIAEGRAEVAKITFNVPADVQRFFQAVQSGTATLASLTPGVMAWLAANEQLERYRIRSAGQ
jgi:hypothetical protein